jgi:hypothetical protein
MRMTCPGCDKQLNVPDVAGKKVRCPGCKTVLTVPQPAEAATADAPMRCPRCKASGLHRLPRNVFTRRPGYGCPECGLFMRHPGTTAVNVFAIVMGVFLILVALVAAYSSIEANEIRREGVLGGAATLCLFAATVIGWGVYQLRKPEPLDAPRRPSYLWLWLLVGLVVILAIAGVAFGFMYYLQEML